MARVRFWRFFLSATRTFFFLATHRMARRLKKTRRTIGTARREVACRLPQKGRERGPMPGCLDVIAEALRVAAERPQRECSGLRPAAFSALLPAASPRTCRARLVLLVWKMPTALPWLERS